MSEQQLYAIRNGATGLIKVGLAEDPQKRLKDLECGAGTTLEILFTTPTEHARTAEAYIHNELAPYRKFREWFDAEWNEDLQQLFVKAGRLRNTKEKPKKEICAFSNRFRKETKKLILEVGKTQKEVAKDLGVSTQYLNEMLNTEKSGVPKRWKELLEYLRIQLGDERAAQSVLLSLLLDDDE